MSHPFTLITKVYSTNHQLLHRHGDTSSVRWSNLRRLSSHNSLNNSGFEVRHHVNRQKEGKKKKQGKF